MNKHKKALWVVLKKTTAVGMNRFQFLNKEFVLWMILPRPNFFKFYDVLLV